ncbi:CatB-related O-acetyltransferase [Chelatococcus daeguensis]|uniref:CatB-related O-acetyltransferase n=1 Tax=Chelatococcus daeguensis TaxID=444444 RepID=UPI000A5DA027|nr:CatB-related O-acetyltransferase [Chelatococcus daeguensis]
MWIEKLWRRWTNPHNLTRLFHAREAARFGWQIGDYSYGRLRVRRWGEGGCLVIGPYCSFADDVTVFLGGNHRTDWVTTYPFSGLPELWPEARGLPTPEATRGDVVIGADVWVGSGATILSGVTIGPGAVIGARAVVARDVPAYAVVVGNPARVVRRRFDEATVEALVATRWWERPRAELVPLMALLLSGDTAAVLAALRGAGDGGRG